MIALVQRGLVAIGTALFWTFIPNPATWIFAYYVYCLHH